MTHARVEQAIKRVYAVLDIGVHIADPSHPLGAEARRRLPEITALSREGVEYALTRVLETSAAAHDVETFVHRAGQASRCHVILSANVCTAPLRAIAFAAATAPHVFVKPSRRDPVIAELIVSALHENESFLNADGVLEIVPAISPSAGDEVHVYASNETIDKVATSLPDGVTFRAHGNGIGIAWIPRGSADDDAATHLAADVAAFDQQGCLSPRIAFFEGDFDAAVTFARKLANALECVHKAIPLGHLSAEAQSEVARYAAIAASLGEIFQFTGGAVGVDGAPIRMVVPPPHRIVHVVPVTAQSVGGLLRSFANVVTTVGVSQAAWIESTVEHFAAALGLDPMRTQQIRWAQLGSMQTPPFDGPVDLRVLKR
ncbi:MAG: proline dehydrogenase [Polyangiaceae bacterium]|nr:proline dehydrogenase [Polyangiaceae bacterium]